MKHRLFLLTAIAGMLSGCAVNRHLNYTGKVAGPGYLTGVPVSIAVQDKRSAVLSGKEKASWCGHNYALAQISYNIQTKSGRPLADEFAELIARSYSTQGAPATPLYTSPELSSDSLLKMFQLSGKPFLLLFEIREWESKARPGFSTIQYEQWYDLKLTVYDSSALPLTTKDVHGIISQKEGAVTSMAYLQQIADNTLRTQVEALFNHPSVKARLEKTTY